MLPEPDISAAAKVSCEGEGPAFLFENVKGFRNRVAISTHGAWRRAAMAVGLPSHASFEDQMKAWSEAQRRYPVKPKFASDGRCKENVVKGDQVNLYGLPVHRINTNDGGFFISKGVCISRDPDSEWVNCGIYRLMVFGRNRTGILGPYPQHVGIHFKKMEERGKPLPIAVAIGNEPILPMVAGGKIPLGWSEFEYAGALRGSSCVLTQGTSVDLPVPADAEIVLEGELMPGKRIFEGPFGEYPGAYTGFHRTPVFEVKTITFRNDAIYESLYIGKPNTEPHYMTQASKLAPRFQRMKELIPGITRMAYLRPYTLGVVIQGRWRDSSEPKQALNAWFAVEQYSKLAICVDEDIDPFDGDEVLWAVTTRVQADKDLVIIPAGGSAVSLDPSADGGVVCKFGIDATKSRPPTYRHPKVDWIEPLEGEERWKRVIEELGRRQ